MTRTNWYRIEAENQTLPVDTLRKIEQVLGVDFGVEFSEAPDESPSLQSPSGRLNTEAYSSTIGRAAEQDDSSYDIEKTDR